MLWEVKNQNKYENTKEVIKEEPLNIVLAFVANKGQNIFGTFGSTSTILSKVKVYSIYIMI